MHQCELLPDDRIEVEELFYIKYVPNGDDLWSNICSHEKILTTSSHFKLAHIYIDTKIGNNLTMCID